MDNTNTKRAYPIEPKLYYESPKRQRPQPSYNIYQERTREPFNSNYMFTPPVLDRDASYYPRLCAPEMTRSLYTIDTNFTRERSHFGHYPIHNEQNNYQDQQHYTGEDHAVNPSSSSNTYHHSGLNEVFPPRHDENHLSGLPTPCGYERPGSARPQHGDFDLNLLLQRIEYLEARVGSLEGKRDDSRPPSASANASSQTVRKLRRDADNMATLERQINVLETRMHGMARTIRDLQASLRAAGAAGAGSEEEQEGPKVEQCRTAGAWEAPQMQDGDGDVRGDVREDAGGDDNGGGNEVVYVGEERMRVEYAYN
ncbi:hypothetical protein F4811DRAFT_514406 [Daldinia bambusicola]|nr:hypothetical protein F4811DRAFT_514406 [Daldinia bambusicola]